VSVCKKLNAIGDLKQKSNDSRATFLLNKAKALKSYCSFGIHEDSKL
jgi:hypothetical protein